MSDSTIGVPSAAESVRRIHARVATVPVIDAAAEALFHAFVGSGLTLADADEEDAKNYREVASAVVTAVRPLLEALTREKVAREIEVATGFRCPSCEGPPTVVEHRSGHTRFGCGSGHLWTPTIVRATPSGPTIAGLIRTGGAGQR